MIAPASTTFRSNPDHPRPAKTLLNQRFSLSQENSQLVSDGLQQSPLCHKFATFLPQVKLEYPLNSCDHGHLHHEIFNDLAPLATDLGLRFARTLKRYDYEQAHQELIDIHQSLRIQDLNLCDNTDALIFHTLGHLNEHPYYLSAKARDFAAALAVVQDLMATIELDIFKPYVEQQVMLLPVLAQETTRG